MASGWKVTLDRAGVGALLKSVEFSTMVNTVAETIAGNIRAKLPPAITSDGEESGVTVEPYTTDRGAAGVIVRHPYATRLQAKYGIISTSVAEAGLQMREYR